MSAEEIKFPPAERRDVRRFEAPPWERKQFEELEERRAAQQAAEPPESTPEPADATAERPEAIPAEQAAGGSAPEPVPEVAAGDATAPEPASEGGADDAEFGAMLAQLAVEEESGTKSFKTISIVSGVLLALIGCVMVVWGVAALVAKRAGAVGVSGGAVLLLFGAGFVAGGAWIGTKHLRERGALLSGRR